MVKDQTGLGPLGGLDALAIILAVVSAGPLVPASAHPAHAKPVNYPFVVGFERFHSGIDDDEYLAEGGLLLLNELNCVACHAPPAALAGQLAGKEATDLVGVATRLDSLSLEILVRNPRFLKRDTTMPSLFAGPDRDLEEVAAIKQYLSTLTYAVPEYERGEVEAGRLLYHRIGCVACHAPEVGYRPEGVPDNAEIEMTGLASVPMNLADVYDLGTLTHFLLHPREHRPSGRMPDFQLSVKEASDLAAYLKAGPDLVLPEILAGAMGNSVPTESDAELERMGRELFRSKNCVACHSVPGEEDSRKTADSLPLATLDPDSSDGCFSARPVGGAVPFYGLDAVQKRALSAALKRLPARAAPDLAGEIDWSMKTLNCYACHERGGTGGPEVSREVYFGFAEEGATAMGRWGHLPPSLDRVGAKLTPDWLARVLFGERGGGEVRPYMAARMPHYRRTDLDALTKHLPEADEDESGTATGGELNPAADPAVGKALFFAEEKGCVSCHDAGPEKSVAWPGIDLATSPLRLRRDYFEGIFDDPSSPHPDISRNASSPGETPIPDLGALWAWLESLAGP